MLDFSAVQFLTFDCYGTLIDWESGILGAVQPVLARYGACPTDAEVLSAYSEIEPQSQSAGYLPYRDILNQVMRQLALRFGAHITTADTTLLAASLQHWAPFPDTAPALTRLASRYKLAIISNIDDELFSHTAKRLPVAFADVITAAQVKSYKPSLANFHAAQKRLGLTSENWVHVAESLFHDIAPANQLGIRSVWVDRRAGRAAASKLVPAKPDLTVRDLAALADAAGV